MAKLLPAYVMLGRQRVNCPWVYLFLDEPEPVGKEQVFKIAKAQTDWGGKLVAPQPVAKARSDTQRKRAGITYKERKFQAAAAARYRWFVTAEVEFDGKKLTTEDFDRKEPLPFAVGKLDPKGLGLYKFDTGMGDVPKRGEYLVLKVPEGPLPSFAFINTGLASLLSDDGEKGVANADGISTSKYEEYKGKAQSLLRGLRMQQVLDSSLKEDEKVQAGGAIFVKPEEALEPRTADSRKDVITLENLFYQASDSDVSEGMTGKKTATAVRLHRQLWELAKAVKPRASLSYGIAEHDRWASALRERFSTLVNVRGGTDRQKRREEGYKILTSNGSFAKPAPSSLGLDGKSPLLGAFPDLWLGDSRQGFEGAILDAIDAASKKYEAKVRSSMTSQAAAVAGGSARDGKPVKKTFERPVAAAAFTFATNHSLCNFELVPIEARAKKWFDSIMQKGGELKAPVLYVDGYASAKGNSANAQWNRDLARKRCEEVANVLKKLIPKASVEAHYHVCVSGEGATATFETDGGKPLTPPPPGASGPDPECLQYVEVYPTDGDRLLALKYGSATNNPWEHRVATVRLCDRLTVTLTPENGSAYYAREENKLYTSLAIAKVSVIATQAYEVAGKRTYFAWVLVLPGQSDSALGK